MKTEFRNQAADLNLVEIDNSAAAKKKYVR